MIQRCSCLQQAYISFGVIELYSIIFSGSYSLPNPFMNIYRCKSQRRIMSATTNHPCLWSHPALLDHLVLTAKYQSILFMGIFQRASSLNTSSRQQAAVCISFVTNKIYLSARYYHQESIHCFEEGLPKFVSVWTCLQQGNWLWHLGGSRSFLSDALFGCKYDSFTFNIND